MRNENGPGVVDRVDSYQRRHPWLGFPLAVVYKYGDDQGPYLAAILTYYAFIAIFPLLLISSSVLGFVLQGHPEWSEALLDSALRQIPIIGDRLGHPNELRGSRSAIVIGALVALYGSMGLGNAAQHAASTVWAVPRDSRGNPFLLRARSLLLMSVAGLGLVVLAVASSVFANVGSIRPSLSWELGWLVSALGFLTAVAVFSVFFQLVCRGRARGRSLLVGAATTAVMWQLLQWLGQWYVQSVINRASEMNGTFALVLGLIGFLFAASATLVVGLEVTAVAARRLYPRALLTPFTDNVDLTRADRAAYTQYAVSQRHKGFQTVTVQFIEDKKDPPAEAR